MVKIGIVQPGSLTLQTTRLVNEDYDYWFRNMCTVIKKGVAVYYD